MLQAIWIEQAVSAPRRCPHLHPEQQAENLAIEAQEGAFELPTPVSATCRHWENRSDFSLQGA